MMILLQVLLLLLLLLQFVRITCSFEYAFIGHTTKTMIGKKRNFLSSSSSSSSPIFSYDQRYHHHHHQGRSFLTFSATSKIRMLQNMYDYKNNHDEGQRSSGLYQTNESTIDGIDDEKHQKEEKEENENKNNESMRVGVIGAGAIAFGTAALLAEAGHEPMLWSPSGNGIKDLLLLNDEDKDIDHENVQEEINSSFPPTKPLVAYGALEYTWDTARTTTTTTQTSSSSSSNKVTTNIETLINENQIIIIAIPANGHKYVFDQMVPYLRPNYHHIIISSHSSLGALYLSKQIISYHHGRSSVDDDKLDEMTLPIPITAWGTTVCTARRQAISNDDNDDINSNIPKVRINTIRKSVDICTIPNTKIKTNTNTNGNLNDDDNDADNNLSTQYDYSLIGLQLCTKLFPQVQQFVNRDGLLAISLSNLNPQNHLGIALGNMSRMEKNELWYQSLNITPNIGRLLESLDTERLNIATELNVHVKTIFDHFSLSFHVDKSLSSISAMNQEIYALGHDVYGPNTADSRYVTEDVPYGLSLIITLGQLVNRPATLHQAGVDIMSAMYGRDFVSENDLLSSLQLNEYTLEDLQRASYSGILQKTRCKQHNNNNKDNNNNDKR